MQRAENTRHHRTSADNSEHFDFCSIRTYEAKSTLFLLRKAETTRRTALHIILAIVFFSLSASVIIVQPATTQGSIFHTDSPTIKNLQTANANDLNGAASVSVPWLHTYGQNIYYSNGTQTKLYGVTFQSGDGSHITQTDIQNVANMGFNTIRIGIEWGLIQPTSPSSINTAYFTTGNSPTIGSSLDSIISWAAQAGMYATICPHWTDTWPPPSWATALSYGKGLVSGGSYAVNLLYNTQIQAGVNYLYKWMAQHYASSSNVIFESFNELVSSNSSDAGQPFANFNNGWITAVEQGEGSNSHLKIVEFLIKSGPWTDLLTAPFINGSHANVLLATHNYSPVSNWDPNSKISGISYVLSRQQNASKAAHNAGYPWINTEWSKETSQRWWQSFYDTMLYGYSLYNAAGWSYYTYCSDSNHQLGWNLHNASVASAVLPILQVAMARPVPGGKVGITGYKLVFEQTMNNSRSVSVTLSYYWSFNVNEWTGTRWVAAGISGSSSVVTGYSLSALSTLRLPHYVYSLPSSGSNGVAWNDWLKIDFTFHWTIDGVTYQSSYSAKVHVHPSDVANSMVNFSYIGADGKVDIYDAASIGANWHKTVPMSFVPTSSLARADINGDGIVDVSDAARIGMDWKKAWSNTPPP